MNQILTLLHKSKGVTIHVRNLQYLMVEVFKSIHNASPIFMSDIFKPAALPYNLRVKDKLIIPKVKTVSNGYQRSLSEQRSFGINFQINIKSQPQLNNSKQ